MEVFLTSKSREIARSAIGFFKVALVTLPKTAMESRLEKLIPNLMVWSHEPKGHFRIKVKALMERLIRKFGYDAILQATPKEDHKLLINIRKTRERKKRGKELMEETIDDEIIKVIPSLKVINDSQRMDNPPTTKSFTVVKVNYLIRRMTFLNHRNLEEELRNKIRLSVKGEIIRSISLIPIRSHTSRLVNQSRQTKNFDAVLKLLDVLQHSSPLKMVV